MNFEVTPIGAAASVQFQEADDAEVDDADASAAYELAVRLLASRAMSSGRLRERLLQREVAREHADAAIERVRELGYLSDHNFAVAQVERLRERKKLGSAALRQELVKLGVPFGDIETALAECPADDDSDLALEAARERAGRMRGLDRTVAERRLMGYLQRRGHGGGAAVKAVREALDELDSPRRRVAFQ